MPLEWRADNGTKVLNWVTAVRRLMDERGLSMAEAVKLTSGQLADPQAPEAATTAENWSAVGEAFLKARSGLRPTTLKDLQTRVRRTLEALETKPKPRDGASLLKAYARLHFADCPPGGEGRRRNLKDVCALLRFAVERAGAHQRWLPPSRTLLDELIGSDPTSTADRLTPPLKPEQFAGLLDSLEADGKPDLHLAVGLVGYLGLRPAELATLTVDNGRVFVAPIKRNARTMAKRVPPRRVMPLDLPGRAGEGDRLIQLFASGLVKLPKSLRNQIAMVTEKNSFQDVGGAFLQLLKRYHYWQALVAQDPRITPYSLRHGWAWRAHVCSANPMHPRQAAALMGHSTQVHWKHYGSFVDEASLEEAAKKFNAGVQLVAG